MRVNMKPMNAMKMSVATTQAPLRATMRVTSRV